ncbi:RHS repeat protein, partial [bacterium]|nr:RHS repeat protein [bacterium]
TYIDYYVPNLGDGAWHNPNSIFDTGGPLSGNIPNPSKITIKYHYKKFKRNVGYFNKIKNRVGQEINFTADDSNPDKIYYTGLKYKNHNNEDIEVKYSYTDITLNNPYSNYDLNGYIDNFEPITTKILTKVEVYKGTQKLLPTLNYYYNINGHLIKRKTINNSEITYKYEIYTRPTTRYFLPKTSLEQPHHPLPDDDPEDFEYDSERYIYSFRLKEKDEGIAKWKYQMSDVSDYTTQVGISVPNYTIYEIPSKITIINPDGTRINQYFDPLESISKETSHTAGLIKKNEIIAGTVLKSTEYTWDDYNNTKKNYRIVKKIVHQGKDYEEEFSYNKYNNVVEHLQKGFVDDTTDNITIKLSYLNDSPYKEGYILNKVNKVEIIKDWVTIGKQEYFYDGERLENYGATSIIGAMGNLTKSISYYGVFNGDGRVTWDSSKNQINRLSYDIYGNVIRTIDSNNNFYYYEYDTTNHFYLTKTTNPLNQINEYSYYPNGMLKEIQDINGGTKAIEYDTLDRVNKMINPDRSYKQIIYSDFYPNLWRKVLSTINDSEMKEEIYSFNNLGRLTNIKMKVENDKYIETNFTYDIMGRKSKVTDPTGNYTQFTYDNMGRLKKIINPDGTYSENIFKDDENSIEKIDGNGHKSKIYFNSRGKAVKIENFDKNNQLYTTTNYDYNGAGNLIRVIDPKGRDIDFYYDTLGRLIKKEHPDDGKKEYIYDKNSNITTLKDAKNQETIFTYDTLNRLLQTTYADGSLVTNTYDNTTISNGLGQIYKTEKIVGGQTIEQLQINGYDIMGRPLSEQYQIPEYNVTTLHNFTYNKAGQVINKGFTYNGEALKNLSYSYDLAGRMKSIYDNIGNRELSNYKYNNLSLVRSRISLTEQNHSIIMMKKDTG